MQSVRRKLQVLIVDDAGLWRDGLSALIDLQEDFAVAAVIGGVTELRTVALQVPPDVIVADLGAAPDRGPELIAAARSRWPAVRILDLTFLRPIILERVVSGSVGRPGGAKQAESDGLSDREREVMKLIAQGLRTREIAERLSVSHKTVEKHRTNLMRKLGVRTAAAVAAYAISNGYLQS